MIGLEASFEHPKQGGLMLFKSDRLKGACPASSDR